METLINLYKKNVQLIDTQIQTVKQKYQKEENKNEDFEILINTIELMNQNINCLCDLIKTQEKEIERLFDEIEIELYTEICEDTFEQKTRKQFKRKKKLKERNEIKVKETVEIIKEEIYIKEKKEVIINSNEHNENIQEDDLKENDDNDMILETQQSSDVTYRFYDYGRLQDGKPRQLHIAQSLDVTTVPFRADAPAQETWSQGDAKITRLVTCQYYTVCRAEINGTAEFNWNHPFVNVSVLSGEGTLDGIPVAKGDHLLITADYGAMTVKGNLEIMYSHL